MLEVSLEKFKRFLKENFKEDSYDSYIDKIRSQAEQVFEIETKLNENGAKIDINTLLTISLNAFEEDNLFWTHCLLFGDFPREMRFGIYCKALLNEMEDFSTFA